MKRRICSIFLALALIFGATISSASAASDLVIVLKMAENGLSALLTLEGSDLSVYGVQLTLNVGSTGTDYVFTPDANDPGLSSQVSVLTADNGDMVTLYLASPYSLGQGKPITLGILSATERLTPPPQGTLILLDAQLVRHEYAAASLRIEGDGTPEPTPTPNVPSSGHSPKQLVVSVGTSGVATLTQSALKAAQSLAVKGPAVLDFDSAALKALQNAGDTVSIGAAVRTKLDKAMTAQVSGALVYDITLATGTKTLSLGSGSVTVSVPFTGSGTPVAYAVGDVGQLTKLGNAKLESGKAVFTLTGDISGAVAVLNVGRVFPDVNGWYDGYVNTVASSGIMKGMEDGSFRPDKTMTRAELVTTLYRLSGDSTKAQTQSIYQDVASDDWFADAVTWAKSSGVAIGVAETAFGPEQTVTREQLAVMFSRFLTAKGITFSQEVQAEKFVDEAQISAYAADSVELMQRAGILSGKGDGRFDPLGTATRAECAKILAIVSHMMG